jgi:hypothetical protein
MNVDVFNKSCLSDQYAIAKRVSMYIIGLGYTSVALKRSKVKALWEKTR